MCCYACCVAEADGSVLEAEDVMGDGGGGVDGLGDGGGDGLVGGDVEGAPDVLIDAEGGVGSPDETAAGEGGDKEHAIVPLEFGAGELELVEEPVDVEEGRGELIEDEYGAVVVEIWSLKAEVHVSKRIIGSRGVVRHTNPIENTASAQIA